MSIDPRSLAIFRLALGLLVLSQGICLISDFNAFYGSDGIIPRSGWNEVVPRAIVFAGLPVFALGLGFGFFTRVSTFGCFVSLIIVQNANPQILQGGDVLLRLLLFWSLLLPLGQRWSMDARCSKKGTNTLPHTTYWATWALTLQICFVYWFAALLKSDPLWTHNGHALFYALNIEHFTTPFGLYLRQFPDLLRVLTFATHALEFIGPCLLFIPIYRDGYRLAAVTLFVGFHLIGMNALLRIGLFPWVCATGWLIFIPPFFWDWIQGEKEPLLRRKVKRKSNLRPEKAFNSSLWDNLASRLVGLALLDVLSWNIVSLGGETSIQWQRQHDLFGNSLHLEQRWNMYAPYPRKEHGWLVIPANLVNETQVDLFTGGMVSWDKPSDLGAYLGDDRWRRYLSNLFNERDPQLLKGYANYLVRNWNQNHKAEEKVQAVAIVFMKQTTQPDLTVTTPKQEVLYFCTF